MCCHAGLLQRAAILGLEGLWHLVIFQASPLACFLNYRPCKTRDRKSLQGLGVERAFMTDSKCSARTSSPSEPGPSGFVNGERIMSA